MAGIFPYLACSSCTARHFPSRLTKRPPSLSPLRIHPRLPNVAASLLTLSPSHQIPDPSPSTKRGRRQTQGVRGPGRRGRRFNFTGGVHPREVSQCTAIHLPFSAPLTPPWVMQFLEYFKLGSHGGKQRGAVGGYLAFTRYIAFASIILINLKKLTQLLLNERTFRSATPS